MAVLRLGRFRTGPAATGEMLARHAALAAAVEDAFPGLIDMPLATAGDQKRDRCVAPGLTRQRAGGVAGAPGMPQAGAVFSAAKGTAVGYAEVVDA
jgi:hypothetical protein